MPRPQLQARFPEDLADDVQAFAERRDISRSEALRRLVDQGLTAQKREEIREDLEQLGEELRADGGAVQDRFDDLEERQERAARASTIQNGVNVAGIAFLVAWFTGLVGGALALVLALVVLAAELGALAYSFEVVP